MCCDLWPYEYGFPNSKKNSFRGNYMRKYGTLDSGINVAPGINVAHGTFGKNIKHIP